MPIINKLPQGGGSGKAKLNIFTQMTEPEAKEGIWLQINGTYEDVVIDTNVYLAGSLIGTSGFPTLPYNPGNSGDMCSDDEYLYFFSGSGEGTQSTAYKYNIADSVYTQLGKLFSSYSSTQTVHAIFKVDNYIYYAGGSSFYSYDVINDTSTYLGGIASPGYHSSMSSVQAMVELGNYIYIFGYFYYDSTGTLTTYKYNIETGVFTSLKNQPGTYSDSNKYAISAVKVGNSIYYISSGGIRIYNPTSDSYTLVASLSETPYGKLRAVSIGTDIYIFTLNTYIYKFDTVDKVFTRLSRVSAGLYGIWAAPFESKIFLRWGASLNAFSLISKQYEKDSFVITRNDNLTGIRQTELFTSEIKGTLYNRFCTGFNNAYLFADGDLKAPPAYYGDGTQWVKFRT